ncbi:UDP-N-acetylmuramoyl-tripeptide--D-alanyl-D-alanine ligase [Nocardioides sp. DS6]|uniref:UDP-N-acetylmuramoyl-tripeptide--D-alanyl-D-alanine ligase n=1 Tax=Nocardioides eburneus TaxID=3231482 RepID=A0ABV3SU70_9ACTN
MTGSDDPEQVVVSGPVVKDSREAGAGSLFAAFVGEHSDGHEHAPQAASLGAVAALGSRPTVLPTVVVDEPQAALQRLATYVVDVVRDRGDLTVLALTGSQGKTSTKDLLASILAGVAPTVATFGSYNNELGVPLTVLGIDVATRFLVLEMGARGRGHITELTTIAPPDVAIVLNVGSAHLGEFGSRDAIATAKGELVSGLRAGGTAVLNADDERVAAMAGLTAGRVVTFGSRAPAEVSVADVTLDQGGRPTFRLTAPAGPARVALKVVGAHQVMNAAAAAAAALTAGATLEQVVDGLTAVTALSKWRMEVHELADGVTVLNDAYNANPDSMRAGLDSLMALGAGGAAGGRTIAVLGEMRELGPTSDQEHAAIGAYAVERGVQQLLVVGPGAEAIHDAAEQASAGVSVAVADNDAASAWLDAHLRPGDVVLFKASNGARLYDVAAAVVASRA